MIRGIDPQVSPGEVGAEQDHELRPAGIDGRRVGHGRHRLGGGTERLGQGCGLGLEPGDGKDLGGIELLALGAVGRSTVW